MIESLVLCALLAGPPASGTERDVGEGPLMVPSGFPLELVLPSYQARSPRVEEKGDLRLGFRFHQANTLVITNGLEHRRRLLEAGMPQPEGTDFLVDLEASRAVLSLDVGLGRGWELGLELTGIGFTGGVGDRLIDEVHHAIGITAEDRESQPRDEVELSVLSDEGVLHLDGSPTELSLGDTLLAVRRRIGEEGKGGSPWVLELAVELATGDEERLTGSGGTDVRLAAYGSEGLGPASPATRHFLTWGLGWVFVGDYETAPLDVEDALHGHFGYEHVSRNGTWSFPAQLVATDSHYAEGGNADGARILLQAAVRRLWAQGRGSWDFGFSQNLTRNDNNADFALTTGVSWRWGNGTAAGSPLAP